LEKRNWKSEIGVWRGAMAVAARAKAHSPFAAQGKQEWLCHENRSLI
jgi:hypothetical protein